ncbi:MAG: hypothetical protein Q4G60_09190 [bacterium]|nr:hypothetical protein [bacterium]
MDMKVSRRDAALLIGLAGILIIVAVYYFVYLPLDEKKIALESENTTLTTRVTELQRMYDEKDTYIAQTESMKAEIDTICNSFPADVKTEDMIMLSVDLANTAPLSVQSISMGVAEDMYHVGQAAAAEAAAAAAAAATTEDGTTDAAAAPAPAETTTPTEVSADKVLYKKLCGVTYQVTYDGFKNAINTVCSSADRRTIDSITATYDINTGLLAATQNINMYYMTGTDKEYVAPTIPFIPQGTDNIFGTIDLAATEDTADTQE